VPPELSGGVNRSGILGGFGLTLVLWSRVSGILRRFSEEEDMSSRYPVEVRRRVVELARSGTKVSQLAETFGMTQASIYSWLKQDRIDRVRRQG
jgi:hypothetical protein